MDKEIEYKAIDLGLPSGLLWANKNIGAATEEDAGLFFQWGDIQGYTAEQVGVDKQFASDWSDYKWGINPDFIKYDNSDSLTTLESVDDVVTQIIGSDWRTPTCDEFVELIDNTDIYFISTKGSEGRAIYHGGGYFTFPSAETMKGVKFYRKGDHSKYIFLPASGYALDGIVKFAGVGGYLWSSSLDECYARYAWYFFFDAPVGYAFNHGRYFGCGIRGVTDKGLK